MPKWRDTFRCRRLGETDEASEDNAVKLRDRSAHNGSAAARTSGVHLPALFRRQGRDADDVELRAVPVSDGNSARERAGRS